MTRIEACLDGDRFRITASGHATGDAAACSGVSALLGALECWLRNAPAGVTVRRASLAPGAAMLEFSGGESARAAAEVCVLGLLEIALAAPAAVAVTVKKAARSVTASPCRLSQGERRGERIATGLRPSQ